MVEMKWDMEIEEIEAVLEKIWDLHDKLSDAIHSISRAHFLNSIKALKESDKKKLYNDVVVGADDNRTGFVYVKEFRIDDGDSAIQEAKSLNAIRTALENLEDQLEFFHTVQIQQRVERDAAIARLEQSRIILALRLADHHVSMIAMMHLHQIVFTDGRPEENINNRRNPRKNSQLEGPSSYDHSSHLDVYLARG
ncbi:hypothetical protein V6Z11_D12G283400 [Gossypium hirsutum]